MPGFAVGDAISIDYFTKGEREIARYLQRILSTGLFSPGVHPVGQGDSNRIGFIVVPHKGVVALKIMEREIDVTAKPWKPNYTIAS